jgi:hypothetical protein
MSYMTKKLHRALLVAAFHLTVRGAHSAKRLNPAIDTFGHSRSLAITHLTKGILPRSSET